ncbi:MAG: N-acetylglucosamine-6-phosphate deacetylase [Rhizobiales bacterium]|nr:N-acetylglucosamine-6-phosphate deacetylase [Hyphomicrobiales bacterium]
MALALIGARIFDGAHLLEGRAVILDAERIAAVIPERELPAGIRVRRIDGLLAPGFIDVQVNGGGGVLFNDQRDVAGIAAIGAAHRKYGTTGFLPTLITDTRDVMREAVAAANAAIVEGVPGILGIHLEGPFLNPERKGVHDPKLMRAIEEEDIAIVTALKGGRAHLTIAPEKVPLAVIGRLAEAGVRISAGHSTASYEVMMAAKAAGLTGVTHLFNAMPPLAGREPGIIGAALNDGDLHAGLIVDMHHVSAASLRVAITAKGWERVMLVTDAMPSVGSNAPTFTIQGRVVTRHEGRLTTADGTLAGSDLDMASAVRNTVEQLGLPLEAALHMASRAPAEFLGLSDRYGRIAEGHRASLVLLDDRLNVRATWIDGVGDDE